MSYSAFVLLDKRIENTCVELLKELEDCQFIDDTHAVIDYGEFKYEFCIHKADSVFEESSEMIKDYKEDLNGFELSSTRIEFCNVGEDDDIDFFEEFLELQEFFVFKDGCLFFHIELDKFSYKSTWG